MTITVVKPSRPGWTAGWQAASPDDAYRWALGRRWAPAGADVLFVMLNPSLADGETDDHTVRRCRYYAESWGYGGMVIGNLYALRTPYPRELRAHDSPVGAHNDMWLRALADMAQLTVVAWGSSPLAAARAEVVRPLLHAQVHCLRVNADWQPSHPARLKNGLQPIPYDMPPRRTP